jgi:hypothetical protein
MLWCVLQRTPWQYATVYQIRALFLLLLCALVRECNTCGVLCPIRAVLQQAFLSLACARQTAAAHFVRRLAFCQLVFGGVADSVSVSRWCPCLRYFLCCVILLCQVWGWLGRLVKDL